jgi:hypothetical protein
MNPVNSPRPLGDNSENEMQIKIAGKKNLVLAGLLAALAAMTVASQAASSSTATGKRPNIVIHLRLWN